MTVLFFKVNREHYAKCIKLVTKKDNYCMIPPIPRGLKFRGTGSRTLVGRGWGRKDGELGFKGYRVSVLRNEKKVWKWKWWWLYNNVNVLTDVTELWEPHKLPTRRAPFKLLLWETWPNSSVASNSPRPDHWEDPVSPWGSVSRKTQGCQKNLPLFPAQT